MNTELPSELLTELRKAKRVAVLTGAGISAESKIPTFRDAMTGLWASFSPEDLATPEAFARNPRMVWDWYAFRREMCAKALPNPGHLALAELETRFEEFTLTTQNVDGLHQRAGSRRVLELHGSITRVKCADTGRLLEGEIPACDNPPPRHPQTGGLLRPDVVWFGEALPERALLESARAALSCDVYFTIGTSALVYPAAALPIEALKAGATVVEINPTETPFSNTASYSLRGKAGEVLPALLAALQG
ncbi:MAG: NAD-dependent deacylase [Planctomycetota bacterium]|nr:NAD-dependent deacylase [Planctomycetota bacterium]